MKSASPALIALLDANQFLFADLYTITTINDVVYRYTNYDYPLIVAGHTYSADGLIIQRSSVKVATGIEVDTLDVSIYATEDTTLGDHPFMHIMHNGGLDGARFTLQRVFMSEDLPTDTSAGTITLFDGRISEVEFSRHEAKLTVSSDLELLNIQLPRNVYQAACLNTLFDAQCGVLASSYEAALEVLSDSTTTRIECDMSQPQGYYNKGVIVFTSGANAGVKRTVKQHVSGALIIALPLKAVPDAGDEFVVYPGCDKTMATCQNRFDNLTKFRGFPFVPVPETAV